MRSLLPLALLLCGCATNPATQQPLQGTIPLELVIRGSGYNGSMVLAAAAADSVKGTFSAAGPVEVRGTVSGRATKSDVQLDLTYETSQSCKGTMRLTGAFREGTRIAEGSAEAADGCVGRLTGTFKVGS